MAPIFQGLHRQGDSKVRLAGDCSAVWGMWYSRSGVIDIQISPSNRPKFVSGHKKYILRKITYLFLNSHKKLWKSDTVS